MRHHIGLYLAISFVAAWVIWIGCWWFARHGMSGAALLPVVIAGSFAPFVAAGIAAARDGGVVGTVRFYRRGLAWRMGWRVFLVSVFGLPVLAIIVAALFERTGGLPAFQIGWADLPSVYLWLFVLGGPLAEEFGWSYLSDALDERFGLHLATLLLGAFWALWHLPLFFLDVPGLSQQFIAFPTFLAVAVSTRFLFSWAYHRGDCSILSNLLMHNGFNLGFTIVMLVTPVVGATQPRLWALVALSAVSAGLLWWLMPPDRAESRALAPA